MQLLSISFPAIAFAVKKNNADNTGRMNFRYHTLNAPNTLKLGAVVHNGDVGPIRPIAFLFGEVR